MRAPSAGVCPRLTPGRAAGAQRAACRGASGGRRNGQRQGTGARGGPAVQELAVQELAARSDPGGAGEVRGQGADSKQMGQGLQCQERGLIFILQEMKGTLGLVASGGR